MIKAWGGDTIETADGRIGTIEVTMYDIGPEGGENQYAIRFPGETEHPRFTTGPDGKYASGDRSHICGEHEIVRVVRYGRHEYHPSRDRKDEPEDYQRSAPYEVDTPDEIVDGERSYRIERDVEQTGGDGGPALIEVLP